ncbi:MAG TPA: hypothetical protein VK897_02390 [Anaerolineales bacterium]|nr:hypothetical protein [Anaerolineales bacterium]
MNNRTISSAPDDNKMEELLAKIQPVPSESFQGRMTQAAWLMNQEKENKTPRAKHLRIAVVFALLLVCIALAASPQGRAFAQRIFLFFTVTEEKSFPIPTEQVYSLPPTETPAPTFILPLEPVEPVTPTQTPPASDVSCDSADVRAGYVCQVKAVEAQAGFNAKEFPQDPKGMQFSQAVFDPAAKTIGMEFIAMGGGGSLYLSQGVGEFPLASQWGTVPADAIKQVSVNGQYAEVVSGTFVVYPNTTEAVWQPGGALRLHWRESDRWFSLEKMGNPYPIEWIDENELVRLAESLLDERPVDQVPPVDPEYLTSIEAAEELAGFDIPAPTVLPEGYELKRVVWADNTARLIYGPKNSTEYALLIFMGPVANSHVGPCLECPPGAVEEVKIGPWQGWYMRGAFNMGLGSNADPTPTPVWEPDAPHWGLDWKTDTLWFSMSYFSSGNGGQEMNKETMIKIAESLR